MSDIHPAPSEFNADEIATDNVLRFFHYSHLPASLQTRSMDGLESEPLPYTESYANGRV